MIFSSAFFLFAFLPAVALLYALLPWKNTTLLIASLFFYAWGEPFYVVMLVAVCLMNWYFGLRLLPQVDERKRRVSLAIAVTANVLVLLYFKYAGFIVENLNAILEGLDVAPLAFEPPRLPLGISFFIFQAITYVVDIYRRDTAPARNPARVVLYISMFPQLVAGPIVRYREVARAIRKRTTDMQRITSGIEIFIVGLAKKVLIADMLAGPVDAIFSLPAESMTPPLALFGALCFAVQILFDFSGYTDMAIGVARAVGFDFPENFNRPYLASGIQDFWRRWHMTLSRWFRDYVYIPLGGSRRGSVRTYVNLVGVFFLTGLWHGASWNFVIWGLYHGVFLIFERLGLGRLLARSPRFVQLIYVWFVVLIGWVWFRAESLSQGWAMTRLLFDVRRWGEGWNQIGQYAQGADFAALIAGGAVSLGLWTVVSRRFTPRKGALETHGWTGAVGWIRTAGLIGLSAVCVAAVAATTQQAFIYFRF